MKLDRNTNLKGIGKYALIKLRTLNGLLTKDGDLPADIADCLKTLTNHRLIDYGNTPGTDFFVIRLKDKYAGPALHAYAEAAKADDVEWAAEIDVLAQSADRMLPKQRPD